jgi:hypothetical protein
MPLWLFLLICCALLVAFGDALGSVLIGALNLAFDFALILILVIASPALGARWLVRRLRHTPSPASSHAGLIRP